MVHNPLHLQFSNGFPNMCHNAIQLHFVNIDIVQCSYHNNRQFYLFQEFHKHILKVKITIKLDQWYSVVFYGGYTEHYQRFRDAFQLFTADIAKLRSHICTYKCGSNVKMALVNEKGCICLIFSNIKMIQNGFKFVKFPKLNIFASQSDSLLFFQGGRTKCHR